MKTIEKLVKDITPANTGTFELTVNNLVAGNGIVFFSVTDATKEIMEKRWYWIAREPRN